MPKVKPRKQYVPTGGYLNSLLNEKKQREQLAAVQRICLKNI